MSSTRRDQKALKQKPKMAQTRKHVAKQSANWQHKYKRRLSAKELYVGFLPGAQTVPRRSQSALPMERASVLPLAPGTPAVLPAPMPPPWARSARSATVTGPSSKAPSLSPAHDQSRANLSTEDEDDLSDAGHSSVTGPSIEALNLSPAHGQSRVNLSTEDEDALSDTGHSSAASPSRHRSLTPPPPLLFSTPTSSYSHEQSEVVVIDVPPFVSFMDVDADGTVTLSPEESGLSADLVTADDFGSDVDAEDQQPDDIDVDCLLLARPPTLATNSPAVLEDIDPKIMNDIAQMDRQNDTAMCAILPIDLIPFDWRYDLAGFTGVREEFTGTPGPTFPVSEIESPLNVFMKIWDQPIMSLIEKETNEYVAQCLDRPDIGASARIRQWHPTSVHELYVFFALLIHQSLNPIPVESEYYYPSSRVTAMPFFKEYISYNRLILLKKFLHFSNNANPSQSLSLEEQRMHKIQPICNHLNRKFQDLYLPSQNIAIDESLLKWHGHLTFIQKIASKAAKTGIKSYELCESYTGYLWKYYIYAGKAATADSQNRKELTDRPDQIVQADGTDEPEKTDYQPAAATAKIVYDLASPLFGKGYTLIMDNYYNSPLLARSLKLRGTDCYGTLRLNRENVPDSMKYLTKTQMSKGDVVASTSGDINVIVWKDERLVSMVSTYHKVEVGATEKYGRWKFKPQVVLDYNQAMRGVDKKDQMLANFPLERSRNSVWYKKLFRLLFNISVQNAYIIYKCKYKNITHRNFRLQLAEGLLKSFWQQYVPPEIPLKVQATHQVASTLRGKKPRPILKDNHFSVKITQAPLKRRCVWCSENKRQSRSTWLCDVCEVALCIECMKPYHTQLRV